MSFNNSINDMHDLAKKRGGKCLSSQYINSSTKLTWQCAKGHIWDAKPNNIQQGKWCPICSRITSGLKRRLTIESMHKLAELNGGKCLSNKYDGVHKHLKWQCSEGHIWEANPAEVKNHKTWCPTCANKSKFKIEDMQYFALEKGGKCLSKKYKSLNHKLEWQCSEGHIWEAKVSSVIFDHTWCPVCASKKNKLRLSKVAKSRQHTIEMMQDLAAKKNGKVISTKYINCHSNLTWQCAKGHIWDAKPNNIQQGKWCPICSSSRSEKLCRITLEQLFEKPFPKSRPTWLINREGNRMELDGYNKELGIAFEYNGEQHLEINHFSPTQEILDKRIRDDWDKVDLCHQHNIKLLVITYRFNLDELSQIIEMGLSRLGVDTSTIDFTKKIDTSDLYEEEKKTSSMRVVGIRKKATHPNQQDLGI